MANLWPWLAVAGFGALHGLSPANGWMFAAAWGWHAGSAAPVRRALLPIAAGHLASVAAVAFTLAQGLSLDRTRLQALAGALLLGVAAYRLLHGGASRGPVSAPARHAGIALWSFLMATVHGAGLMLVPALVPLCLGDSPARAITVSGSLALALAAVGVHTAAMLLTTGAIAAGVARAAAMQARALNGALLRHAWTAALAVTGTWLMAPG